MKFPYFKTPRADPRKKWVARPIIPVVLSGPKKNIPIYALIDSGADKCLFNAEVGTEIGIDLERGEKEYFSGIEAGRVVTYLHKIHLQISGIDKMIEVEAGFTAAQGVVAILGQEGFFDNFRIKFEKDHNTIEITPVKD
jgi:predicted aspartyl protease